MYPVIYIFHLDSNLELVTVKKNIYSHQIKILIYFDIYFKTEKMCIFVLPHIFHYVFTHLIFYFVSHNGICYLCCVEVFLCSPEQAARAMVKE